MKSPIVNILSLLKLSLGVFAIIFCLSGRIAGANFLILGAVFLVGCSKMLLKSDKYASPMDKEIDSMSVMVSLGLSPALCSWKSSLAGLGFTGYIFLLLFISCSIVKLSRNNSNETFQGLGLPVTAAGSLLLLDNISIAQFGAHAMLTAFFISLLSYLMVSSIRITQH